LGATIRSWAAEDDKEERLPHPPSTGSGFARNGKKPIMTSRSKYAGKDNGKGMKIELNNHNFMESVDKAIAKFNDARKKSRQEHLSMVEEVDVYLNEQAIGGLTKEDVLKKYFYEYKDIIDNPLAETMTPAQRLAILKQAIYDHEIRPRKKQEKEKKLAA